MRSSNPTLTEETFDRFAERGHFADARDVMTVEGTANKTGILLLLTVLTASFTWGMVGGMNPETAGQGLMWALGGGITAFIVALIAIFNPKSSPVTAPIYAALEGLFLGGISVLFNMKYPGIVPTAVGLTFGVMAAVLIGYRAGFLRATPQFQAGVIAATLGVCLFYAVLAVLRIFNVQFGYFMWEGGWLSIVVSLIVVAIAAMNLVLDFDLIEDGAARQAPKFMEWYGAFGLMTTLVWLYLEILRLLSKLRR
jgi:uncharacterized YccA/Bax inhibitor family protein